MQKDIIFYEQGSHKSSKTAFSMKANLPGKEPALVEYWDKLIYTAKLEENKGNKKFVPARWSSICEWKYSYGNSFK